MQKLILLAAAGAVGTLARFGVVNGTTRLLGLDFPWGTLAVNLAGCSLFGLVLTLSRERGVIDANSAQLIPVGFMGAFTSRAACRTLWDSAAARVGPLLCDVALQNLGGLACLGGAALARLG